MPMTRADWDNQNRLRSLILGALKDNPGDAFSAGEILASIVDTDLTNAQQMGRFLAFCADDGLVIKERNGNSHLWRISQAGLAWTPQPYDWRSKRPAKAKAKDPEAAATSASDAPPAATPTNAPAVSSLGDLAPHKGHRLANSHPWVAHPAVTPATPKPALITRPLPIHLESPMPQAIATKDKPINYTDDPARDADLLQNSYVVEVSTETPAPKTCCGRCGTDAHDQPVPARHLDLKSYLIAEADMREDEQQQLAEDLKAEALEAARETYLEMLLTMADEAAAVGDHLGRSRAWRLARDLAPVFDLEICYA